MNTAKKHLKEILLVLLITLCGAALNTHAQRDELGIGLGGMTYTGEVLNVYRPLENRLAGVAYYRYNLGPVWSVRGGVTAGQLQGSDFKEARDVFRVQRDHSFNIIMLEPSVIVEYNFLNYKYKNSMIHFSPFLFAGVGAGIMLGHDEKTADFGDIQPVIPFGIGFKYMIDKRWVLNAEFGARKTFTDYIDNLSSGDVSVRNFQQGNASTSDYYYFVGISLSYTFWRVICPFDFY